ncbi:uncharacterized protein LOC133829460 isoform X2 [Humulus lupulus]|uniref:uncharacterized protein LOC133829460 isoform X2 n=1 Tax=Humulus lupulus TaxID=3486 RepID=UPI002B40C191|nr:uncharacterized protein LOC133829460 isoform X2 [Humulus lupulus]
MMDDVHSGRPVFEVFNIVPAGKLPQQDNGHDCGIFVMRFMEYIASGKSPPSTYIVDHNERFRFAIDIVLSESNGLFWDVMHDATAYYGVCSSKGGESSTLKEVHPLALRTTCWEFEIVVEVKNQRLLRESDIRRVNKEEVLQQGNLERSSMIYVNG